ncbi:MAG TPA: HEAT repeat domain-containing protein [Methanoregula sp.]|nr:HEAT repeat domain-containing protein [Methanoregula sp.]
MSVPGWLRSPFAAKTDTGSLLKEGNIPGLIRLLGSRDPEGSRRAAAALGSLGSPAVPALVSALGSALPMVRLGAAEALGTARDARAVPALARVLGSDRSEEVRWQAAIALGEIGSVLAVPALVRNLRDRNRYVRLGSAEALKKIGWEPRGEADRTHMLIALQDWEALKKIGPAAAGPLHDQLTGNDPATKEQIIALLSGMGDTSSGTVLRECMKDRDPRLRWHAVFAGMDCGIAPDFLPRIVAGRERTGPVPAAAALLNFLFLGIGYNYIGKWWGFPVFMSYMTLIVLAQLAVGPFIPYLVSYPVTAVFAVQTYFAAKKMSDF